jgi:L-seryl-tRNA(Ser) seleniumtransferase
VGGGSLPDQPLPTWVVEVEAAAVSDAELARRLRAGEPAVMPRARDGKVILDVRTVFAQQEPDLLAAIAAALQLSTVATDTAEDDSSEATGTELT